MSFNIFCYYRQVSKDVREIVKLAVNQAHKRNRLSEYTSLSRITAPSGDLDPFEGEFTEGPLLCPQLVYMWIFRNRHFFTCDSFFSMQACMLVLLALMALRWCS